MNYLLHLLVMIGIYLPLAYSLNLILGFGGLLSLCHAAFYGIGAYAYVLSLTALGLPPGIALLFGIGFTLLLSVGVGWVSLRFRGDLFLFVTLGFQMILFVLLYNWVGLTNGPYGIAGIPRPELFGVVFRSPAHYVLLAAAMNLVLLPILFALYRSPFGLALEALREDETEAESLGFNADHLYLQAFAISAAIAAIPGAFYASYVTYIDPTSFTLNESIFLAAILLLGGAGNRIGPLVGVIIMLLLPEVLRFVGLPDGIAHNLREIIYGLMLAVLMYLRPQGIAGEYRVR
uniref:Branched-chain amino acid transport system permease protein n=1 Tax=Candidatus Kentrum sp. FM TaxID=2126340 RepID=A0A450RW97_9GAMM|nr:MAG: branched-chain amino acid transport system permease protein [Candidatus Kentron sp. FM]VFJ43955.1 MAG: branched-chain amino acid transport system permease protein [Candidatus Kentron sp. FM]VFK06025.1 MAG: branched-chain amino acid transport system permease protein [Candidatus Kentron sp. FM]